MKSNKNILYPPLTSNFPVSNLDGDRMRSKKKLLAELIALEVGTYSRHVRGCKVSFFF